MVERGLPAPKLPTAYKPVKTKANDPPQPAPLLQMEPEATVPPDQLPDPSPPVPQDPPPLLLQHTYQTQYSHKTSSSCTRSDKTAKPSSTCT